MNRTCKKSLKRRIIVQFLIFYIATLGLLMFSIVTLLATSGEFDGLISDGDGQVVSSSLYRNSDGTLALLETNDFDLLRQRTSGFWFIAKSADGQEYRYGQVPEHVAASAIKEAEPSKNNAGFSIELNVDVFPQYFTGPAGELEINGQSNPIDLIPHLLFYSHVLMLPFFVIAFFTTIVAIPVIVNRAFKPLASLAKTAQMIDVDRRGQRLADDGVMVEIRPFVSAVNGALERLDEGYEQHKRFILDAAHELRTPVAILQTRLENLGDGPEKYRLLADAARIASLAEQLLDIQRLSVDRDTAFLQVDLVQLCQSVVAELAPIAVSQGYDLSLEADVQKVFCLGDVSSLSRAVTNLVQNAIEHAGNHGMICVTVSTGCTIEVADEGHGISEEHRQTVFEPFHRLRPKNKGAGLGLNLVRQIVSRHNGTVSITEVPNGGALFRIALPPLPDT